MVHFFVYCGAFLLRRPGAIEDNAPQLKRFYTVPFSRTKKYVWCQNKDYLLFPKLELCGCVEFEEKQINLFHSTSCLVTILLTEQTQVMGPPPDPRGHLPFTPYSGFTLGTPVFTHYTSARP